MPDDDRRLSDVVSAPLMKAYKTGGYGLTLLLLGALIMLGGGGFLSEGLAYTSLFLGFLIVLIPAYFFYTKEIRPLGRTQDVMKSNSDLMDTVQTSAQKLCLFARDLETVMQTNAEQVAELLESISVKLDKVPLAKRLVASDLLINSKEAADKIHKSATQAKIITEDISEALRTLDVAKLRESPHQMDKSLATLNSNIFQTRTGRQALPGQH